MQDSFLSSRMNKCLERVNGRHFWNPGVFSYAMIPRSYPNSSYFFIVTSIVYDPWSGLKREFRFRPSSHLLKRRTLRSTRRRITYVECTGIIPRLMTGTTSTCTHQQIARHNNQPALYSLTAPLSRKHEHITQKQRPTPPGRHTLVFLTNGNGQMIFDHSNDRSRSTWL
jgi:hypothetical protein